MKWKQDILSFEWEWDNYLFKEYNSPRPYFDNIEKLESLVGRDFHHEDAIEDHWMNATNDYDVHIKDCYRMTLYLAEKALQLNIPEEIRQKDAKELLDPLFNLDKISERSIMDVKVDREEANDINH